MKERIIGLRTFYLSILGMISFTLIALETKTELYVWLGLGIMLLIFPKTAKDIFRYVASAKLGQRMGSKEVEKDSN